MKKTTISWTNFSINPIRFLDGVDAWHWHCEKVSAGCAHCYAETLEEKFRSGIPFTRSGTAKLFPYFDGKMANTLYKQTQPSMVFAFDMTDIFGAFIPDHIRAAAWAVMLDNPHLTFQVLTKRPESAVLWAERWYAAIHSPEYAGLMSVLPQPRVKLALEKARQIDNPWASNIWMGTSIEDMRAMGRMAHLKRVPASLRFLSAEPLLGAWDAVDLSGISWVIVGGESGLHLRDARMRESRWMKMEWARGIRDLCVEQGVAFFFKQQSGLKSEQQPYIVEEDGAQTEWRQYPELAV